MALTDHEVHRERRTTFGIGLLKGMAVTLKHLFKHNTVIQYPDEKQDLSPRTRGVIALKEENCTVCMLCARECPDWCIYIDSHKETIPPKREGGRQRKRNVLDRFAIDYALCMYCGICVEVCPYDALFWSREFEYSEYDIRMLTHEKEKLSDWMSTVLPPPALEEGAELPGQPAAAATAPATTAPATAARPATPTSSAAEARPEQAAEAPKAPTAAPQAPKPETPQEGAPVATAEVQKAEVPPAKAEAVPEPTAEEVPEAVPDRQAEVAPEPKAEVAPEPKAEVAPEAPARPTAAEAAPLRETPGPNVEVPHEEPHPVALQRTEDAEQVYTQVLQDQLDKGSSPQVAEARARVARVKAERGIRRGPTPMQVEKPVPSAPTKGEISEPVPGGAPAAEEPKPDQGPVAPQAKITPEVEAAPPTPPPTREQPAAEQPAAEQPAAEQPAAEQPAPEPEPTPAPQPPPPSASAAAEDPEAAYERVLAEERAKGSSEAVAVARAKAARVRAQKGTRGPAT